MNRIGTRHSNAALAILIGASAVCVESHAEYEFYFNEPIIHSVTGDLQVGLRPLDIGSNPSFKYLVQDVCVDQQDRPIPKDPLDCAGSRRKLRLGEDLPYSRLSISTEGNLTGATNSYPILIWNRVRFVNSHLGAGTGSSRIFRHYMQGDGYDVTESLGGYSFIYGTRDPRTIDQNYIWCGMFGQNGGGWILFPDGATGYGDGVFSNKGDSYDSCQPTGQAFTQWTKTTMTFTAGKRLSTMKTLHYSRADYSAQQIEIHYQSEVYGAVRWEAWKSDHYLREKGLLDEEGLPKPSVSDGSDRCNGPVQMERGGNIYFRTLCHDWSHIRLHDRPLHAYHVPLSGTFTSSPNALEDSDFASGTANAWVPVTNGEMTHTVRIESGTKNRYLEMNKTAATKTSSVYQTVRPRAVYRNSVIQGGALMKGPANDQVVIEVTITDSRGSSTSKIRALFRNGNWTPIRFNIPYQFDPSLSKAVTMRFRVYAKSVGVHVLDEPFLAVLPVSIGTAGWLTTPSAPSSLSVPVSSGGGYSIGWSTSADADRYELWESSYHGPFVKVLDGASTSKIFSNKPSGEYQYKVRACNVTGCSTFTQPKMLLVCNPDCQ